MTKEEQKLGKVRGWRKRQREKQNQEEEKLEPEADFTEGFLWLVINVFSIILPFGLICLYKYISLDQTELTSFIKNNCGDIILFLFSISLNLLTLLMEKRRIFYKGRRIGQICSVIFAITSLGYYYFYYPEGIFNLYAVIIACSSIVFCGAYGYATVNKWSEWKEVNNGAKK